MSRLLLVLILTLTLPAGSAAPAVVVSIPPIHSLAAGVMQGQGEPRLLVPGGQSPHHFTLRPSDARALAQADLVIWVGPELEGFLTNPLRGLRSRALMLLDMDGIRVLHADAGYAPGHDHAGGEPGGRDAHLWLDPRNAMVITRSVAATLSEMDPIHADQYQTNARRLAERLSKLDLDLERRLASVQDHPYVVFHDAYRYLEQRYGLRQVGVVSIDPERRPGARTVRDLRATMRATGARCVFREPQFPSSLMAVLLEGTGAKGATLDPLGTGIPLGPDAYFELMRQLADALVGCLLEPRPKD